VIQPESPVALQADSRRLESAVVHLVRNAVDAAGAGGHVRVGVSADTDAVEFQVDDDGEGVAEDLRDRLFEPFFTTKPAGRGSGLGLAVAHAVAEEHGGAVEVGTSPLGGARFTLRVPRGEEADGG
jgi:signal transduction histidine kinase